MVIDSDPEEQAEKADFLKKVHAIVIKKEKKVVH